jgi:hypothetical protein
MKEIINSAQTLFDQNEHVAHGVMDRLSTADVNLAFVHQIKKLSATEPVNRDRGFDIYTKAREHLIEYIDISRNSDILDYSLHTSSLQPARSIAVNGDTERKALPPTTPSPFDEPLLPESYSQYQISFSDDFYYKGPTPPTQLRFGSFLYYNGLISYKMLVDALRWQRKQRPLMGQLALIFHYITPKDLAEILFVMDNQSTFGQTGMQLGKLTDDSIETVLAEQKQFGCEIGQYFIKKRMYSQKVINFFLLKFFEHNKKYR